MDWPRDGALEQRREKEREERGADVNAAGDLQRAGSSYGQLAQIGSNSHRADAGAAEEHRPRDANVLGIDPVAVARQCSRFIAIVGAGIRRKKLTAVVINRSAG